MRRILKSENEDGTCYVVKITAIPSKELDCNPMTTTQVLSTKDLKEIEPILAWLNKNVGESMKEKYPDFERWDFIKFKGSDGNMTHIYDHIITPEDHGGIFDIITNVTVDYVDKDEAHWDYTDFKDVFYHRSIYPAKLWYDNDD